MTMRMLCGLAAAFTAATCMASMSGHTGWMVQPCWPCSNLCGQRALA